MWSIPLMRVVDQAQHRQRLEHGPDRWTGEALGVPDACVPVRGTRLGVFVAIFFRVVSYLPWQEGNASSAL
jgi:hypothetical protein